MMRRALGTWKSGLWAGLNISSLQTKRQVHQSLQLRKIEWGNSLECVIAARKSEARKSVVVQVNSEGSFSELYSYCSQFGDISNIHHYTLQHQHFMLIEFSEENDVNNLLSSGHLINDCDVIPAQSSFLWFRSNATKTHSSQPLSFSTLPFDKKLVCVNGCEVPNQTSINDVLSNADSITDQIKKLYEITRLNDIGTRLRFMVSRQIECVLSGLFPNVCVSPFGSSVNGFGKLGCDLDLILRLTKDTMHNNDSRLVFHTKKSLNTGRLQQQKHMEVIGDIVQVFLPGCSQVRRILQARIPIIKFNQDYAGVECDLSMGSMSGLYMSELLYLFGCIDERVKPLTFVIRKWAQSSGITNSSPGRWITNFPLTLMVIFFLQNTKKHPILPTYNYLRSCADKTDTRITEDNVNCTFLRDINRLSFKTENQSSLEKLLLQFFEFYSTFDFCDNAISINEGKIIRKLDHSPLYIVNPLETTLNVSKNVSFEECEKLQIEMKNAAWHLDTIRNIDLPNWGLIGLFKHKDKAMEYAIQETRSQRLVSVKDLFNEKYDGKTNDKLGYINSTNKARNNIDLTKVYYKNENIKNEIEQLKKKKSEELDRQLRYYTTAKHENKTVKRKTRRR